MRGYLKQILTGKKVLILGFGKEGRSTLNYLNQIAIDADIIIADSNEQAFANDPVISDRQISTISGPYYLSSIREADIVIKSPGIALNPELYGKDPHSITSQTDLFLAVYRKQVTGITGTKGKSTTSSLLAHILGSYFSDTLFGGNIGIPLFDLIDRITPSTRIVCELSSHQLQFVRNSPHIAILLNLFQEHLDHYDSYEDYQRAKYNIALYQEADDYFIYNSEDTLINNLLKKYPAKGKKISLDTDLFRLLPEDVKLNLPGAHNRINASIAAAAAAINGIPAETIIESVTTFQPLEHRLQYVGIFNSRKFYNDSISTIPEAAIAAIESLKPVNTLILGGFDRGIDYSVLADYLKKGNVKNVVTTGPAGYRIFSQISGLDTIEELYYFDKFDEAVSKAIEITPENGICLLSPAASSYNEFRNFEERGKRFIEIVKVN
ncbi:MAG TPA: UDP-N-acetylmuramoyl-L-alanine--D-glutamate ligase [Lentimicrobium sp.]|nr:UDP-N-acetylmuramoyl-L-alanine--D-glutamate ligase [Lentimicrobium sp.]